MGSEVGPARAAGHRVAGPACLPRGLQRSFGSSAHAGFSTTPRRAILQGTPSQDKAAQEVARPLFRAGGAVSRPQSRCLQTPLLSGSPPSLPQQSLLWSPPSCDTHRARGACVAGGLGCPPSHLCHVRAARVLPVAAPSAGLSRPGAGPKEAEAPARPWGSSGCAAID